MNTPTVGQMKGLVDTAQGLLDRQIFFFQEIYQQELEKIFARCWFYLGHVSQIPNPNDFLATYMGEDPVLLCRGPDGRIRVFLNMCRHRGNRVCRADQCNAKDFMCSYHGWIFNTEGRLIGVRYPQNIQAHLGHEDKIGPIDQAVLSAANLSGIF